MANKVTSVVLAPADLKLASKLTRALTGRYGKVSFSFLVREALRALDEKIINANDKQ